MDIRQYISSGIIEAYVLGIASAEEMAELEALSLQYPEVEEALNEYRRDLEAYADLHATPPPAGLKEEIWATLQQEENNPAAPADDISAHPAPARRPDANEPARSRKLSFGYGAAAAAVLLLVVSIAFNIIFWNKTQSTDRELAGIKKEQRELTAANSLLLQQAATSEAQLALLTDPAVKPVLLAGVGAHTANAGMVFWDTRSKEVYLSLKNLPPPPGGRQYQLWAIVDGKPVDAGVYALNSSVSLQKMKVIPTAQMFAITLERAGGSPTPTLEEMYVAGKI